MHSFALLLVCVQACLVQTVFGQCLGKFAPAAIAPIPAISPCGVIGAGIGPLGYAGYRDLAYPVAGWGSGIGCGIDAYGGVGEGNVAVAGELPVAGTTAVAGQVPIMGAVKFGGDVCAGGAVSIAGKCACGCGCGYDTPYLY